MGGGRLRGSGNGDWHDDCINGSLEAFIGSSSRPGSKIANLWAFIRLNYNTLGLTSILYTV